MQRCKFAMYVQIWLQILYLKITRKQDKMNEYGTHNDFSVKALDWENFREAKVFQKSAGNFYIQHQNSSIIGYKLNLFVLSPCYDILINDLKELKTVLEFVKRAFFLSQASHSADYCSLLLTQILWTFVIICYM